MLYSIPLFSSRNSFLPILTAFIGNTRETRPAADPSVSDFYKFIYCEEGEGTAQADDGSGLLFPGQLLFLQPETSSFRSPSSGSWKLWHLSLTGPCCRDILTACGFDHSGIYGLPKENSFVPFMKRLMDAYLKNEGQKTYSVICYELLLCISQEMNGISVQETSSPRENVRRIQEYLESHFNEHISLEDIAGHVHLTEKYICTLYKEETGHTIMHQLTSIRIGQARQYLEQNPEMKIKEVGALCGFSTPGHFGRTFLKWMGTTPELYRKALYTIDNPIKN